MPSLCWIIDVVRRADNWFRVVASVEDWQPSIFVPARRYFVYLARRRRLVDAFCAKYIDACAISKMEVILATQMAEAEASFAEFCFVTLRDFRLLAILHLLRSCF